MAATGQEMVREKNSSRAGKSKGISLQVRENRSLWKKSGRNYILRVHIIFFSLFLNCCLHLKISFMFYRHESYCIGRIYNIIVHEIEQVVNELHLYQFLQTAPELLKA